MSEKKKMKPEYAIRWFLACSAIAGFDIVIGIATIANFGLSALTAFGMLGAIIGFDGVLLLFAYHLYRMAV